MEKILIIDDEVNIRESIRDFLEFYDYDLEIAASGEEGIKKAREFEPDLILCDVNMGKMNGYEVIKTLRKDNAIGATPFVFLTAKATMGDLREGMDLGADDYLTKPFELSELLRCIKANLEKNSKRVVSDEALKGQLKDMQDKVEKINFMNSHELRAGITRIMSLKDSLKNGISLDNSEVLRVLEGTLEQMDATIHEIGKLVGGDGSRATTEDASDKQIGSIALVDDDEIVCFLNQKILQQVAPGVSVLKFTLPTAFVEAVESEEVAPDLVLLDINMPFLNGFEVLEKLTQLGYKGAVVMLSSSIQLDEIERAKQHPLVSYYELKPLTIEKTQMLAATVKLV
ncbi:MULTISPECIES: response regulator [unclassified Imperialibacter]|uniref:response regulator n=1 Tax=unclassified Imperialibacter TaxID=2629706 RepID=UPI0012525310|nr:MULTISPECIES: response regulator [unclassified Imperialibacter]CAD5249139.1 putative Response regulator receiver domain-containing protein [Imperialibacter sp. 89]CAD5264082.1 putative Response regulator receiver domain-containing protein [Imperialibacter sp. 75]VVT07172.1 conserved hypothetical protein [Imperialibacter sp. EC-SDR9]